MTLGACILNSGTWTLRRVAQKPVRVTTEAWVRNPSRKIALKAVRFIHNPGACRLVTYPFI